MSKREDYASGCEGGWVFEREKREGEKERE